MSASSRHLAVGSTLEQAAQVLGGLFDELELTTFTDLGDHVDLELLGSLSLVSGTSSDALLPGIVAQRDALGSAAPPVYLGRPDGRIEALGGSSPVISANPAARELAAHPEGPRSRRRRQGIARPILIAAATTLALGALVILLSALTGGTAGVLVALGAEILLTQLALVVGVAYLVRLVRRHVSDDADAAAFREELLERSRDDAKRRSRRFDSVDQALLGTRGRVDALSRLVSRGQATTRAREHSEIREITSDREPT